MIGTMESPDYKFAGGTLGGQTVTRCSSCGSLVMIDDCDLHTHAHLTGAFAGWGRIADGG